MKIAVLLAVVLLTLAGCGSDSPARPGAAEPATAPATSGAAVGTVRPIGPVPEGIVYDPTSKLVAVTVRHPDRLLLVDPTSLAVRRSIALPGHARHLQLGDRSVLVPAESANELVQVALPAGTTTATTVRKQPHDAAQAPNGDIVVGDEFGKSISIIRNGVVIKTIADLTQPGGVIATDGTTVGVVDVGAFTLSTYDLTTLKRVARVPAGKGPTHGDALPGNRFVVADTRGNRMLVYSVTPLRQLGSLALPGTPYGMAVDRSTQTVWVTLTARNQVVGLDLRGDTPRVVARYATVRQPNTVAVDPGSHHLWITGSATGVLQLITR